MPSCCSMTYAGSSLLPCRVISSPFVVRVTVSWCTSLTVPVTCEVPHFHLTDVPVRMLIAQVKQAADGYRPGMAGTGRVRVGISGWRYAGWRGDFYPKGLPQRAELEYAAQRLTSIEINGSFYSLQRPSSYLQWRDQTPDDFVFAVKGGRFITHMKRLAGVEVALANFFASGVLGLGHKLGPVLWQLPETLAFEEPRVRAFFDLLPRTTKDAARLAEEHDDKVPDDRALTAAEVDLPLRHALEFRSPTFGTEVALGVLADHDIACVFADTAGRWPRVEADTADFRYVRLHGDAELYASGYSEEALADWAARCRARSEAGQDVFVYFDNDIKGYAPYDALRLIELLG